MKLPDKAELRGLDGKIVIVSKKEMIEGFKTADKIIRNIRRDSGGRRQCR